MPSHHWDLRGRIHSFFWLFLEFRSTIRDSGAPCMRAKELWTWRMPEGKSMISIRRLAALILLAVALASPAESQAQNQVQSTRVTFLLVSDIYLMADSAMAD